MRLRDVWKFELEKIFSLDFGLKCKFSKLELSIPCSIFLRQLKIQEKQDQKNRTTIAGKKSKIAAGNCYLQFPIHNSNKSRAVLFLAEDGKCSRVKKK